MEFIFNNFIKIHPLALLHHHELNDPVLTDKINHISTAGGALVLYLTGEKLPMIKALEDAAIKNRSK